LDLLRLKGTSRYYKNASLYTAENDLA
jgi:hypothetical protein